jgi:2-polyprenyl-6-methoxyphenol hydroxylase-like FAD-dependent oxidoreductase
MHDAANRTWMPVLSKVMKLTPKPTIGGVYDCNPLKQLAWRRVVLVGEAAHPTTPHADRSTNMAIVDAHELGKALRKHGPSNVSAAFAEYEGKRLPAISQQVLFSRHVGQLKQGNLFEPKGSFPWPTADDAMVEGLLLRNMNFFQWRYS